MLQLQVFHLRSYKVADICTSRPSTIDLSTVDPWSSSRWSTCKSMSIFKRKNSFVPSTQPWSRPEPSSRLHNQNGCVMTCVMTCMTCMTVYECHCLHNVNRKEHFWDGWSLPVLLQLNHAAEGALTKSQLDIILKTRLTLESSESNEYWSRKYGMDDIVITCEVLMRLHLPCHLWYFLRSQRQQMTHTSDC